MFDWSTCNRVPLYMYVIGKTDFILRKVHNNAKHTKDDSCKKSSKLGQHFYKETEGPDIHVLVFASTWR